MKGTFTACFFFNKSKPTGRSFWYEIEFENEDLGGPSSKKKLSKYELRWFVDNFKKYGGWLGDKLPDFVKDKVKERRTLILAPS